MRLRLFIALACAVLSVPSVASAQRYGEPGYGGYNNEALIRVCRQQGAREMGINIKYVIAQYDGYRNGNVSIRLQNQTGALVYRCMIDPDSGQIANFFREGYGPGPDAGDGMSRDELQRICRDRALDVTGISPRFLQGYPEQADYRRASFLFRDVRRGGPNYRCVIGVESGRIFSFERAY